jgi:hypothetical protein
VATAIEQGTGHQRLASAVGSEESRAGRQRLLRPRVIAVVLLIFLGIAAALLSAPERDHESELGAPTAAYESNRFDSAN